MTLDFHLSINNFTKYQKGAHYAGITIFNHHPTHIKCVANEIQVFKSALTFKSLTTYIYIYIYMCRTAALTSRRYILNIYSTNIHTEYFKHAA